MKKCMAMLLAVLLVFGLVACGNSSSTITKQESKDEKSSNQTSATEEKSTNTSTASEKNNGSNVLVVYYSATGSTKAVANTIAKETAGNLFELTPVEEYTSDDLDYNNSESRVCKEYDDENLRDVELTEVTPKDFEDADVIFIGYPIWWGIAAWPVNQFVKNNDFTGKTVIPFCTSASSGLGDSGKLLEEMAGTGDWKDGMRFSSGASEEEVLDWVKGLNLN